MKKRNCVRRVARSSVMETLEYRRMLVAIHVSGASAFSESQPMDGGAGGRVVIHTGVAVDAGNGSEYLFSGSRVLTSGEYHFATISGPTFLKIDGTVTIRTKGSFNPISIEGVFRPGQPPPVLRVFAGGEGLLLEETGIIRFSAPSIEGAGQPTAGMSGGTFEFYTPRADTKINLPISGIYATGGDGAAGGSGGNGGTVEWLSAGDPDGLPRNLSVNASGGNAPTNWFNPGLTNAGSGGNGGTITLAAFAGPLVLESVWANGGYGASTSYGNGGNGGNGGQIALLGTHVSRGNTGGGLDIRAFGGHAGEAGDAQVPGTVGGRGGNGGAGGAFNVSTPITRDAATFVDLNGGNGGHGGGPLGEPFFSHGGAGGHGGARGQSRNVLNYQAKGGDGGFGGAAGRTWSPPSMGQGGAGGNAGSLDAVPGPGGYAGDTNGPGGVALDLPPVVPLPALPEAPEPAQTPQPPGVSGGLVVSTKTLDFGKVTIRKSATQSLFVHNTGAKLVWVSAKTTASFFGPDAKDKTFSLGPGEQREIAVHFKPIPLPGLLSESPVGRKSADLILTTTETKETVRVKLAGVGEWAKPINFSAVRAPNKPGNGSLFIENSFESSSGRIQDLFPGELRIDRGAIQIREVLRVVGVKKTSGTWPRPRPFYGSQRIGEGAIWSSYLYDWEFPSINMKRNRGVMNVDGHGDGFGPGGAVKYVLPLRQAAWTVHQTYEYKHGNVANGKWQKLADFTIERKVEKRKSPAGRTAWFCVITKRDASGSVIGTRSNRIVASS